MPSRNASASTLDARPPGSSRGHADADDERSTTSSLPPADLSAVAHRPRPELLNRILELSMRRTGIQLPVGFVRSRSATVPPPLTVMIRGGRGGEVRLKLYCCLTLLAVEAPYKISRPVSARTWAEMLALPNPDTNGARRVQDALKWLDANHMVKLERRPSYPPELRCWILRCDGSRYVRPDPLTSRCLWAFGSSSGLRSFQEQLSRSF